MEKRDNNHRYDATDWEQFDVPAMWSMLEGQQTDSHWRHVSGWKKVYELASEHLSRLMIYRENLADAWPPEKSRAAALYMSEVDRLINNVRHTYDTAVANYSTLAAVTGAISTARSKLKKIYDEYVSNQHLLAEHANKAPVSDPKMEQLRRRARSVMYELSGTLVEARAQVKQPRPYRPRTGEASGDSNEYGTTPPPVIPPIVPVPMAGEANPPPRSTTPTAAPTSVPQSNIGPVLGGASQATPPPPASAAPGTPTPSPAPSSGIVDPPGPPAGPGIAPRSGVVSRAPFHPGVPVKPSVGLPKAMPPGGLIGGPPGTGLSQPAGRTRPVARINPIGGVIGDQSTSGVSRRQRDSEKARRWAPDNPWETEKGVPAVLQPTYAPGRDDPGPAIGLNQ